MLEQYLYEFGPFQINTRERMLLRDGKRIPLKPKVYETLIALITNSGRVLEKEERAAIAADLSPAKQVAHAYGVSVSYVYKIRHEHGTSNDRRRQLPLPREVIDAIKASELGDDELSALFDISVIVVRDIREASDEE